MDQFVESLRAAFTTGEPVLLVQCGPTWFGAGAWTAIMGVERLIVEEQLHGGGPPTLIRVLPYDLPTGSASSDTRRHADWVASAALTAVTPTRITVSVWLSTRIPDPADCVAIGQDIQPLLLRMRPHLIAPDDPDWGHIAQCTI